MLIIELQLAKLHMYLAIYIAYNVDIANSQLATNVY